MGNETIVRVAAWEGYPVKTGNRLRGDVILSRADGSSKIRAVTPTGRTAVNVHGRTRTLQCGSRPAADIL